MSFDNFNTARWTAIMEPGYFYISVDEYYLYVNKLTEIEVASGGLFDLDKQKWTSKRPVPAPVVITDVNEVDGYVPAVASGSPFAKTWEPPVGASGVTRTPDKYRRRYDLTGIQETILTPTGHVPYDFILGDHEYVLNYTGPDESGFYLPTVQINPTDAHVIVEHENPAASGLYQIMNIDFNPIHSTNVGDRFIVITDSIPNKRRIIVDRRSKGNVFVSDEVVLFDIVFETNTGMPIQNQRLDIATEPGLGTLNNETVTTDWDGTATGSYQMPSDLSTFPASGIAIRVSNASATGVVNIEAGFGRIL